MNKIGFCWTSYDWFFFFKKNYEKLNCKSLCGASLGSHLHLAGPRPSHTSFNARSSPCSLPALTWELLLVGNQGMLLGCVLAFLTWYINSLSLQTSRSKHT